MSGTLHEDLSTFYCSHRHKFGMKGLSFHVVDSDMTQQYVGNTLLNCHCNCGYVDVKLDWLP
jgi:hypothetical protein